MAGICELSRKKGSCQLQPLIPSQQLSESLMLPSESQRELQNTPSELKVIVVALPLGDDQLLSKFSINRELSTQESVSLFESLLSS